MTPRTCRGFLSLNLPRMTHTLAGDYPRFKTHKPPINGNVRESSTSTLNPVDLSLKSFSGLNADQLFDETPELDVVSATKIIGRFARQRQYRNAICIFSRMFSLGIRPTEFTFGTVIPLSTALRDLDLGRQFHAIAMKMGLHSVVFVGSALLDVYSKLSLIDEARRAFEEIRHPNVVSCTTLIHGYLKKQKPEEALQLFQKMPERNTVSWNAMISGYSQMGYNEEAVNLFIQMLREGLVPNASTFPCLFTAASNIAAIGLGRSLHACVLKFLANLDVFIDNSIINFYAKCGSMEESLLAFDRQPERSIVSWNAVICGFAQNGRGEDAEKFFERMRATGLRPDGVTLLGLLSACMHDGRIDKGYSYFNQARLENSSILGPEHYACMVGLLSRCGRFAEAQEFLHSLPFRLGIGFWKSLLVGCQMHSNVELAELAAEKILALDPEDVSSYIMLSNAYSAAGRWQDVIKMRRQMKKKGMKRVPGCSWTEISSKVNTFVNSDRVHHQKEDIYSVLSFLYCHFKESESSDLS